MQAPPGTRSGGGDTMGLNAHGDPRLPFEGHDMADGNTQRLHEHATCILRHVFASAAHRDTPCDRRSLQRWSV